MDSGWSMTVGPYVAFLGAMALGAWLYWSGFREGRREATRKPVVLPFHDHEVGGFEAIDAIEEGDHF